MVELVRCPGCRGAKQVPKLGGMVGECNVCKGTGKVGESVKPVKVLDTVSDALVIQAVSECVPLCAPSNTVIEPVVDVNPKKAIFKRKGS